MLVRFQDKVFLFKKSKWFMWESAWDCFRPVDAVSWDGTKYVIDDKAYCSDPSSDYYGFGSKQMEDFCESLEYDISKAIPVSSIPVGNSEWFRDRMITIAPCASRDKTSWKKMLCGTPYKTCRNITRNRFTKRNLLK
jgi:hypothetical protein